ncbi:hypothetical protein [Azoarcus sp. KH32C]|uniref:hypothetical protein n=1 Tax=Azoarcus sp. KH32C TaxID=748247 RepID=UPI0002386134|nr:hypothetical protein [Azoarcus sp. KH32C]BAL24062.1 hypothetical protein AZKH_1749 [Azoarcus sp. KH32C]
MLAVASRVLLTALLTFVLVWALVLGWWQANEFAPTTSDLLLCLGALPLLLVASFWLLRGFIEHLKNPASPAAAPPGNPDAGAESSATCRSDAVDRLAELRLLGVSVVASAGNSAEELLAAVVAGDRPKLDPTLRSDEGFPIFTARVSDLTPEVLADIEAESGTAGGIHSASPEQLRALALVDKVLPSALAQASEFLQQWTMPATLELLWLIPESVAAAGPERLAAWLNKRHLRAFPHEHELHLKPVADESETLRALDELILRVGRDDTPPTLHLVLGATSHIGEATTESWNAEKRLFSANNQPGQIPGEAAACLLLASPRTPVAANCEVATTLSRVNAARRDKPADARGRVSGHPLATLIDDLLAHRKLVASDVRSLLADSDHRDTRIGELHAALDDRFEAIDPIEDCHPVGTVCGTVSPIASLIVLACAHSKAQSADGPVVYVSNQDPIARAAMLITPFFPPPASESAPS